MGHVARLVDPTRARGLVAFGWMPGLLSRRASCRVVWVVAAGSERDSGWLMPVLMIVFFWMLVTTLTIVRGGNPNKPSVAGVYLCSTWFWVLTAAQIGLLAFTALPIVYLKRQAEQNPGGVAKGDVAWTNTKLWTWPLFAMGAGVLGSMLGLGGGVFIVPFLLSADMEPSVVAATSITMVFISASASTLNYWAVGNLMTDYTIWLVCFSFVAALIGTILLAMLVKKYKRYVFARRAGLPPPFAPFSPSHFVTVSLANA